MIQFQRAREKAIAIRNNLLAGRAGDAVHSRDLLKPFEATIKLGISPVAPGSLDLGAADAILRREEKYIYVRNDISASQQAYLIFHELGHFLLDDEDGASTIASLKALGGADGSPGVIKVEAYGARERQELQANVFAREILLPRSVARKLFDSKVGPRKVAADFGIELEVARQQMLDAALLPDVENESPIKTLHAPSTDQKAAAEAKEKFANVVAGPGTGKTSTLIHRVKYLINDLGVNPRHILVLTFTNKAAFELVERLRDAGITRAPEVWAGTFHAFGLEFLRKYHKHFGLDPDIVVADKLNSITLLNKELPRIGLKFYKRIEDPYNWLNDVISGIKRLKEEMVSPSEYCERISSLKAPSEEVKFRREDVATLYEAHERLLQQAGMVDFVDLVSKPAGMIKADRAQYAELADKFQHILVDEYQDVTFAMVELVRQLAEKAKSVWVVGDVRQAIHHWRGASVRSLIRFNQIFKAQAGRSRIRTYPLTVNRRSSGEILAVIKEVGERHILQESLPLEKMTVTAKGKVHPATLISCDPKTSQPQAIVKAITAFSEAGLSYGEQAVICRWNAHVGELANFLRSAGIPVLHVGELAQRTEIKAFVCLMQLLVERHPRAMIGLMSHESLRVEPNDLDALILATKNNPTLHRGGWREQIPNGLSSGSTAALKGVTRLLTGLRRRSNPWEFVCDILLEHQFGMPNRNDQSLDAQISRIALWQFAYTTRSGDGERRRLTLSRFLLRQQLRRRIGETYADRELPSEATHLNGVRLLTVHGSKGLEFEAVHLAYVNADDFGKVAPDWKGEPDVLQIVPPEVLGSSLKDYKFEAAVERNNLLYVAVSRSKQRLYIYEDADAEKRPEQLKVPSPCTLKTFKAPIPSRQSAAKPSEKPQPSPIVSLEELETYATCHLQHWYRYVLGLSSENQADVAIRARWAILSALKKLANHSVKSQKDAFIPEWEANYLPDRAEDPGLWRDAVEIFKRGAKIIKESTGTFSEPKTIVNGLKIQLPWVLTDGKSPVPSLERIALFAHETDWKSRFWRPMLNDLKPSGAKQIKVHSLFHGTSFTSRPSGAISQTTPYKAAESFRAGDQQPSPGWHCATCAYSSLCPTMPKPQPTKPR